VGIEWYRAGEIGCVDTALSQLRCEGDLKNLCGFSNQEFSPRKTAHLDLSVFDTKAVNAVSLWGENSQFTAIVEEPCRVLVNFC